LIVDIFHKLVAGLLQPRSLTSLALADWDRLIRHARSAGMLARLDALLAESGSFDSLPCRVKNHLIGSRAVADHQRRILLWEVNRIGRALDGLNIPCVLLKGGAYAILDLPFAHGRISTDVDILVPKSAISAVEKSLLDHGWKHIKIDDYDQYFYRHWSHELPPLQHRERGTVVDVHHTILPPTGRLRPDPEKLIAASLPLKGTKFRVLAPVDMVLHSAAHGFQDGDLKRPLRDLVDIDGLLRYFGHEEKFWRHLGARAEELDLTRPLYYALRYAHRYLQTPVAPELSARSTGWSPPCPALWIMDTTVDQVVTAGPCRHNVDLKLAQQSLYIRSHWLRMPPYLLIPHLIRKALKMIRQNRHSEAIR
jgi:Uncharacterised nucleotidyltransferase